LSLQQVIFTTELLHTASDTDQTVSGSSVTEPLTQDVKNDTIKCKSCIDGTGDDSSMHATKTASARTNASKPSKILFRDYYASRVSSILVKLQITRRLLLDR